MKKRDFETYQKGFRDPAKIFRDPRFSRYHSPPLLVTDSVLVKLFANWKPPYYNTK